MKKRMFLAAITFCAVLCFVVGAVFNNGFEAFACSPKKPKNISVTYNGYEMDLHGEKAYYSNKTLMVPIQQLTEELGATVTVDRKGQLVIDNWKHIITLKSGKKYAYIDGKKRKLSDKIVKNKGVFYAPYELLEKDFDLTVDLDKCSNTLKLETKVEVERIHVEDQLIAGIRFRGQYTEIADYYLALREVVGDRAIGGGFSLYYDQDYEIGHDTEICLNITEPFESTTVNVNGKEATIECRILEGGEFLSATHLGHANTLGYLWTQIEQYAVDECITFGGASREIYDYEDFTDDRKQVTTVQIRIFGEDDPVPQMQRTSVYINNEKVNLMAEPIFKDLDKNCILPTELISNLLGAEVYYTNSRKEMNIITDEHTIMIPANSATIIVDGTEQVVSAECLSLNNTIYVPKDFFETYFGVTVTYDSEMDAFFFEV